MRTKLMPVVLLLALLPACSKKGAPVRAAAPAAEDVPKPAAEPEPGPKPEAGASAGPAPEVEARSIPVLPRVLTPEERERLYPTGDRAAARRANSRGLIARKLGRAADALSAYAWPWPAPPPTRTSSPSAPRTALSPSRPPSPPTPNALSSASSAQNPSAWPAS